MPASFRAARKWLLRASGIVALSTATIGVLHTSMARPLLMRLGGCPLAGAQMTAEQMDRARHIATSGNRSASGAPARPALGFELDATTLAQTRAWASREHVKCEDVREGLIKCSAVPPKAFEAGAVPGPVDELALGFNPRGVLVNVTTLRTHLDPEAAARQANAIASSLAERLGAGQRNGNFDANQLAESGAQSLASVSYRYRDYLVDVTAMTLPHSGPSIREHYMSAND